MRCSPAVSRKKRLGGKIAMGVGWHRSLKKEEVSPAKCCDDSGDSISAALEGLLVLMFDLFEGPAGQKDEGAFRNVSSEAVEDKLSCSAEACEASGAADQHGVFLHGGRGGFGHLAEIGFLGRLHPLQDIRGNYR